MPLACPRYGSCGANELANAVISVTQALTAVHAVAGMFAVFKAHALQCFPEMQTPHVRDRVAVSQISPADAQLRRRIEERMHQHGQVDATKIGIVVRGGQVLLWGSVADEHERTLAGQIAADLTGRTAVINHIQVFRTTQS
jgi:osmotically-inducible protein OsmY